MKRNFVRWVLRLGAVVGLVAASRASATVFPGAMPTYHNDNTRAGANTNEEILSPANVVTNHFGKLWVLPLDGRVDAQPLYVPGVAIPGKGARNVVFAATEHDSVYTFDADSTNQFWKVSMLGTNETTSDPRGCDQVVPEIGVTATPVIDLQLGPNGTMFVVAMTKDNLGHYHHRIHALDLATGTNRTAAVEIAATYPGTGDNSSGGNVIFDPAQYKERCGLTLVNGVVYTAWSSHCDFDPYTGWIMGYDERTLAQTNVLNIVPNGSEGAIWMSGAGLAVDAANNLYFLDGNGTFDATLTAGGFPSDGDYGNSFMKLSTTGNQLAVADYFAIYTNVYENDNDIDLGSGGVIVLPDLVDGQGHVRQLAVGAGKDQNIYLVDRSNMGKFNASSNAIYQELGNALVGGIWSMPAYFNGALYFGAVDNHLQAFPFQNALLQPSSSQTSQIFPYPGTTPSVSANGVSNSIVWAAETNTSGVLHAYAAANLATEYYNSSQASGGRDNFGTGIKFTTPTIASARVYIGVTSGIGVFGLLDTSTLTPLQVWRNSYFGNPSNVGAGANTARPAGDGVMNLIKYALGLNPTNTTTAGQLPAGRILQSGGQSYAELVVNRAAQQPDITYVVEISGDLHTWASGPGNTVTLTNTATQLVVRDNAPLGGAPRFLRLRITVP